MFHLGFTVNNIDYEISFTDEFGEYLTEFVEYTELGLPVKQIDFGQFIVEVESITDHDGNWLDYRHDSECLEINFRENGGWVPFDRADIQNILFDNLCEEVVELDWREYIANPTFENLP